MFPSPLHQNPITVWTEKDVQENKLPVHELKGAQGEVLGGNESSTYFVVKQLSGQEEDSSISKTDWQR